jgi:hypothetical protein
LNNGLQVCAQLTSEMLELVRSGAAPIPPRDRLRYYDLVSASLRKGRPLLTNAALVEAIRAAQRESAAGRGLTLDGAALGVCWPGVSQTALCRRPERRYRAFPAASCGSD